MVTFSRCNVCSKKEIRALSPHYRTKRKIRQRFGIYGTCRFSFGCSQRKFKNYSQRRVYLSAAALLPDIVVLIVGAGVVCVGAGAVPAALAAASSATDVLLFGVGTAFIISTTPIK